MATSDAELIAASRHGDAAAFGAIVERYQRAVCAVSYSGCGDRALGEDVAQDTFVTAWRQLAALRDVDRLPAWLCGIARNLARAARRRHTRDVPLEDHDAVAADSPFDAVSEREAEQVVAAALARVPETYREPLVLFYCEQQSIKAVARALGISEAATAQRLARGRQHLAAGVRGLVERTLGTRAPRRGMAAAVVAAIALLGGSRAATAKGMVVWKLATAATIAAVLAGTGALLARGGADPVPGAAVRAASPAAPVALASPPPALATTPIALPARVGVALACPDVARHMTDLAVQSQPDLLAGAPDADRIAAAMKPALAHFELACTTEHWSPAYMACIAAADDLFTLSVTCASLAPPRLDDPRFVVVPDAATPRPPYTGSDTSCASVGAHVALLSAPEADANLSAQTRAGIERARATLPDQVAAACDQHAWPETTRRCMLDATVPDALARCM